MHRTLAVFEMRFWTFEAVLRPLPQLIADGDIFLEFLGREI